MGGGSATSRKKVLFLREEEALPRGRRCSSCGKKERYLEEEGPLPTGRRRATSRKRVLFR
jgi:hypothetical protein